MGKNMYQASSVHRDRPLHLTVNHQCTDNTSLLQHLSICEHKKRNWTILRRKRRILNVWATATWEFDTFNIFIFKSFLTSFAWTASWISMCVVLKLNLKLPIDSAASIWKSWETFEHWNKIRRLNHRALQSDGVDERNALDELNQNRADLSGTLQ